MDYFPANLLGDLTGFDYLGHGLVKQATPWDSDNYITNVLFLVSDLEHTLLTNVGEVHNKLSARYLMYFGMVSI